MSNRCLSYLAYVWDVSREGPTIYLIPIEGEFVDVFPNDQPSLPLECDIDFSIEVELGLILSQSLPTI